VKSLAECIAAHGQRLHGLIAAMRINLLKSLAYSMRIPLRRKTR
jgi:hypothetical protein